jgi:putative ABC transport system ATP-binding protein
VCYVLTLPLYLEANPTVNNTPPPVTQPLLSPQGNAKASDAIVTLTNIVKQFDGNTVLHNIDVSFPSGGISYVVGPSGCGKTTLISIIAGILTPNSGQVHVLGQAIDRMNQAEKAAFRRENIGFIFQQFNLIATVSIAENVAIPLLIKGVPYEVALDKAKQVLKQVGLGDRPTARPADFSGGQQQRVAIARALVNDPKLIICDEPTSALDGKTGQQIMELFQQVAEDSGKAVIIVTHDNRIYKYADTLIEMEDGRIQAQHADARQWAIETGYLEAKN